MLDLMVIAGHIANVVVESVSYQDIYMIMDMVLIRT